MNVELIQIKYNCINGWQTAAWYNKSKTLDCSIKT